MESGMTISLVILTSCQYFRRVIGFLGINPRIDHIIRFGNLIQLMFPNIK